MTGSWLLLFALGLLWPDDRFDGWRDQDRAVGQVAGHHLIGAGRHGHAVEEASG